MKKALKIFQRIFYDVVHKITVPLNTVSKSNLDKTCLMFLVARVEVCKRRTKLFSCSQFQNESILALQMSSCSPVTAVEETVVGFPGFHNKCFS